MLVLEKSVHQLCSDLDLGVGHAKPQYVRQAERTLTLRNARSHARSVSGPLQSKRTPRYLRAYFAAV
jgi:hypothetical protein